MRYLILILLMIGFVSAIDVDFDCPREIFVDEEFECSVEVFDGDGVYDVKVELDQERDSVLEIWDEGEGEWLSGYYYLKEFVEDGDSEDVRLRVLEEGDYDGVLKLRQGDKREFFEIEIEVLQSETAKSSPLAGKLPSGKNSTSSEELSFAGDLAPEVISLNAVSVVVESVDEDLVYVSKDSRIVDYLPYGFSLFLILVIVVLVWERF